MATEHWLGTLALTLTLSQRARGHLIDDTMPMIEAATANKAGELMADC
jgi:hypothetical protein